MFRMKGPSVSYEGTQCFIINVIRFERGGGGGGGGGDWQKI